MMTLKFRRALLGTAAVCVTCAIATPSLATDPTPKWCGGVKIAAIVPGYPPGSGDAISDLFSNGYRQAEVDLGPSVAYSYANWDTGSITSQLQQAIEAKVDAIAFPGYPGDAAADALIDKAFAQGTIVTSMNMGLPEAEKKHSAQGLGYVAAHPYPAGFGLASEAARRADVKPGDKVLVWRFEVPGSQQNQIGQGMSDALEKAGARIVALDANTTDPNGVFIAAIKANPDLKLVITDESYFGSNLGTYALAAGLKPGQIFMATTMVLPMTAQAIKDGYVSLTFDSQDYLHGYLSILNLCLTKKFGFSGLHVDTSGAFIDATNVEAVAPMVQKGIR
jgi:simple sugar transport system substrate-binding protein